MNSKYPKKKLSQRDINDLNLLVSVCNDAFGDPYEALNAQTQKSVQHSRCLSR